MSKKYNHLDAPLTFLINILLLEVLLALLAGAGLLWSGVLLFVLLSTLQIVTLILVWYVFRFIMRVNERLESIESQRREEGASDRSSEARP